MSKPSPIIPSAFPPCPSPPKAHWTSARPAGHDTVNVAGATLDQRGPDGQRAPGAWPPRRRASHRRGSLRARRDQYRTRSAPRTAPPVTHNGGEFELVRAAAPGELPRRARPTPPATRHHVGLDAAGAVGAARRWWWRRRWSGTTADDTESADGDAQRPTMTRDVSVLCRWRTETPASTVRAPGQAGSSRESGVRHPASSAPIC